MIFCNDCYEFDLDIECFGSSILMSFEGIEIIQDMKVVYLCNVYICSGMFGLKFWYKIFIDCFMGDQVIGYGLLYDGGVDMLELFLLFNVFYVFFDCLEGVIQFVVVMFIGMVFIVG